MAERSPDDAEWERIVASLRGPDTEGNTTWPEVENRSSSDTSSDAPDQASDDQSRPDETGRDDAPPGPGRDVDEPVIIWRGSSEDIDAEIERAIPDEHFVPPDPPPLPRADAITWAAWLGVVGAPLLLLLLIAFGVSSGFVVAAAVAAFLAGLAILIGRMRSHRDPFDPDDGAVV
jgi:hypothetical protein